jgi:hypothetical protein
MIVSKSREELVVEVASAAHADWRAQYKAANGDKPRMKTTKDQAFLDRGITEVDIAALPTDWQGENKAGAECAVDCLLGAIAEGKSLDADFVETASAIQHDKWLERNGSWAPESQKKPYAELSEEDRFFVRAAVAAYQG